MPSLSMRKAAYFAGLAGVSALAVTAFHARPLVGIHRADLTSSPVTAPSANILTPAPGAPPIDPAVSTWGGYFSVGGTITMSSSGLSENLPAPSAMDLNYSSPSKHLQLSVEGGQSTPIGVGLDLDSATGDTFNRLDITEPDAGNPARPGSFGLLPSRSLKWLSLPVGDHDSAVTLNGVYDVIVTRSAETTWIFAASHHDGGPPVQPWLSSLSLNLTVDAARPPWNNMSVDVQGTDNNGTMTANLSFLRSS